MLNKKNLQLIKQFIIEPAMKPKNMYLFNLKHLFLASIGSIIFVIARVCVIAIHIHVVRLAGTWALSTVLQSTWPVLYKWADRKGRVKYYVKS